MIKLRTYFSLTILLLSFISCEVDQTDSTNIVETSTELESNLSKRLSELFGSLDELKMPDSDEYSKIPNDPKNQLTQAKVNLGKFLFHETQLGVVPKSERGMQTYSCASCHHVKAGFQSGLKQGIGEGGWGFGLTGEQRIANPFYDTNEIDVQPIRSPSILNVAYQDVMLWNGQFGSGGTNRGTESQWTKGTPKEQNHLGFQGVEIQAIAGLGVHRLNVNPDLIENGPYKDLFDKAFPNDSETERYSLINTGLAIASYERSVLANEAPFQKFLRGESGTMTNNELKGAQLFFSKGECYKCHSGPGLNGMSFHALGMNDLSGNIIGVVDEVTARGRGGFTKNTEDNFKFKTPTLYNLSDISFLGHGGSFNSVNDIIKYKNEAIPENRQVPINQLDELFTPLNLNEEEIDQLTSFIENALYDSNLTRYVPEVTPLGTTCFPNADAQSLIDMDCN